MTTDDFTEAARAEAERYFADPGVDPLTLSVIDHAMHMAEWARTHLAQQNPLTESIRAVATTTTLTGQDVAGIAQSLQRITQEPTDAEVEAAARAWAASSPSSTTGFDGMNQHRQNLLTTRMRAALSAARVARPALEQRIRELHTADEETGNCIYCTRGRIYPVPAPCATVRLLEDEATR